MTSGITFAQFVLQDMRRDRLTPQVLPLEVVCDGTKNGSWHAAKIAMGAAASFRFAAPTHMVITEDDVVPAAVSCFGGIIQRATFTHPTRVLSLFATEDQQRNGPGLEDAMDVAKRDGWAPANNVVGTLCVIIPVRTAAMMMRFFGLPYVEAAVAEELGPTATAFDSRLHWFLNNIMGEPMLLPEASFVEHGYPNPEDSLVPLSRLHTKPRVAHRLVKSNEEAMRIAEGWGKK